MRIPCLLIALSMSGCFVSAAITSDAGESTDAGAADAGNESDSGVADAGHDAGMPDSGSDAGTPDAGSMDAGIDCSGGSASSFPTFSRACSSDSQCTIGFHQTNCCGSLDALGLATSAEASFAAAETTCDAMYPGCGCDSGAITTDDGAMASGQSSVVVHCVSGMCETSVRPGVMCSGVMCTSTQECIQECSGIMRPGDAGPLPSDCVDVPSACAGLTASDCSCFGGTDPCPTGQCMSVQNGVPLCICA